MFRTTSRRRGGEYTSPVSYLVHVSSYDTHMSPTEPANLLLDGEAGDVDREGPQPQARDDAVLVGGVVPEIVQEKQVGAGLLRDTQPSRSIGPKQLEPAS